MKNNILTILSIVGMTLVIFACLLMNDKQEESKSFINKKVVIMNDTLLVVGTTPITNHILLSNGAEIDVTIAKKYLINK